MAKFAAIAARASLFVFGMFGLALSVCVMDGFMAAGSITLMVLSFSEAN